MELRFLNCLLLGLAISGCGAGESDATKKMAGQLVPVTGTITLNDKPLAGVTVNFHVDALAGQGENATGVTDEAGKYTLSTYLPGAAHGPTLGAIPGEYQVTITKLVMPDGSAVPPDIAPADAEEMKAKQLLPAKYSHLERSQLKGTVRQESTVIDFTLKSTK